ncbi:MULTISPECIES: winged helix-turn-helix transcriptional regulator [unclassified Fusibacter]|uniref:winged helix-turn-helix transcriptional regulator n=1 Tax=unclassified Fusibacter TaxID=2624464 RepID=UPI0010100A01|nr:MULTISPECIES: winged helix-turn-helix transcriptional regulator [unclassified Fusibacter]MCK8061248.1 winged helix-turn-helix transcriptional regulator [Fusibacter sp. A2]NPE23408.1 winged helix-turn-helix transcriptional regulator [Fusibacter sp. A1]RXV59187.1 winged helix-turn-helix transcriptional regulator [Fusibacter sp. A1]
MEEYEINMLQVISDHDYISQRAISNEVGMSLGNVNILIKKFIKTGIVMTEKLDGNKVRYMLTPKGFTYLSKKTLKFIARSYKAVLKIQSHMLDVITSNYTKDELVLLKGEQDEIAEILVQLLKTSGYKYKWIDHEADKYLQWNDPAGNGVFLLKDMSILLE